MKENTALIKNIPAQKIIKIILAIILSNIFFFMLFSHSEEKNSQIRQEGIEVIIEGNLMTSFAEGKEVLLTQRSSGFSIKATLLNLPETQNSEARNLYLVLTSETDAHKILGRPLNWSILPYLKDFNLNTSTKKTREINHEIRF